MIHRGIRNLHGKMGMRFFIALLILCCVPSVAQENSEFPQWMETASQSVGRLILSIQSKDSGEATAAARVLQEVFGEVAAHFESRGAGGAVKYAKAAKEGFQNVEGLIAAGKFDEAYTEVQATRSNCDHCHKAHREKSSDGSYRIKY